MGTHPIFESDFDCLTEMSETKDENIKLVEADPAENKDEEKKVVTGWTGYHDGRPNKCSNKQHFYWQYVRPLAAEFITSMILIFNVCSLPWPNTYQALTDSNASFVTSHPLEMSQEMPLMPAFTAGFTVFALLTMFHYVTVAHISPTVTFGFALSGNFDFKLVVPYILAQILGAITGAALAMIGSGHGDLVGVVGLPDAMTSTQITALLIAEMQVSFILCLSTNLVVGNKNWDMPVATLMIGLCVFIGIMAGHMSGAGAMNPARVLGPAILAGNFNYHWVWWVASLLGSLQCAAIYKLFFAEEEKLFGLVRQATKKTYTEIPTNNDA